MASGDLYTGRIQYNTLLQEMENVFHIRQLAGTGDSVAVADALSTNIIPFIQAVQSDAVVYKQIVVVNLDNSTDFATIEEVGNGDVAGETMPPFVSWGFTFFSTDTKIRSGGKRFGVPSEASIIDGQADAGTLIVLLVLASKLADSFQDAAMINTYEFVLHTDGNLATSGAPLTVPLRTVLYRRVTTQSSRKFAA